MSASTSVHLHTSTTKEHLQFLFIPLKLHGCLTTGEIRGRGAKKVRGATGSGEEVEEESIRGAEGGELVVEE